MNTCLVANKSLNFKRRTKNAYVAKLLKAHLRQFSRNLLVQNFADGERFDGAAFLALETINFKQGIAGKIKADEIAELAFLANHHGFKGVNVGTANFIRLLYLNRIPFIGEIGRAHV